MEEVSSCLRMLDEVYRVFGLTYKAALSTRPDSYLGTLEQWDAAEAALRAALDQTGKDWEVGHFHFACCCMNTMSSCGSDADTMTRTSQSTWSSCAVMQC